MFKAIHPSKSHIADLKSLWNEGFGDTMSEIDRFFTTGFSPTRCLCILLDGKVAAAAYWLECTYPHGKLAYIYAVSTAKKHRGKGLCHHLFKQIHHLLFRCGYAGAILVPEDGLSGLYASMGYCFFGGMDSFSCQAALPIPLRHIGKTEYATLRRHFLPSDAVLQENENLDYLETMAQQYAGEDFILAARKEGECLLGLELLGNRANAPGIVAALGCRQGRFRTPGEAPFAMFCPLKNVPSPSYFGIAFD